MLLGIMITLDPFARNAFAEVEEFPEGGVVPCGGETDMGGNDTQMSIVGKSTSMDLSERRHSLAGGVRFFSLD